MVYFEKAVLFYNKNAGESEIEQKLAEAVPILGRFIRKLTMIHTESAEDMRTKCVEAAAETELIIVLGGDGTVHTAVNSIAPLERRPALAILPGGTSNDFSRTLNMPQKLAEAAESMAEGRIVPIDVGKSNDDYFLNFWGVGLVSDTSKNVDEDQKESFGVLSYFMSTLRTIKKAETFQYEAETSGERRTGEAILIFILNGRFVGTRRLPINEIDPQDGKLNVLIARNSNLASLRELMSLESRNSNIGQFNELDYFTASELSVMTDAPKEIDMDGEMYTETPSKIHMLPSHLQFLVPGK